MDWLMGKARGVGKGLMSVNTTTVATSSATSELTPHNYHISPSNVHNSTANTPCTPDGDMKIAAIFSREVNISNGSRSVSPSSRTSPSGSSQSAPLSSSAQKNKHTPPSRSSPTSQDGKASSSPVPIFMQEKYCSIQLIATPDDTSSDAINFYQLVEPFPSMDQNEWLAAHSIALFDNISTIFDAIHEFCTCPQLLPVQTGTVDYPPVWSTPSDNGSSGSTSDDDRARKSKNAAGRAVGSARQEIDTALSSCHDLIQSSRIFPVRQGDPFPSDLPVYVTLICKNLLICIIHVYLAHFHHLDQLELVSHMNTLTRHFFAFTTRFSLVEEKHFAPLLGLHRVLLDAKRVGLPVNT